MQGKGLLIAAVLLAALAGGVWYSNKTEAAKEGKPPADASPKLIDIPQDQFAKIEIAKKGGETVVLEHGKDNAWKMVAPKPTSVDSDAVSSMVSTLSSYSSDKLIEEKASDLAQFGLNAPELTVNVTKKDGKSQKLLIGDETPTGGGFFAKLDGDPRVFTIYSYNKSSLDKTWKDLRDKRLLTFDSDKISRVELSVKGQTLELGKAGSGDWQILKPGPYRADNVQVDEIVRKLKDAKMDTTVSDADAAKSAGLFAAGTLVTTAKITDPSGVQQIDIRKNKDDFYAKSSVVEGIYKIGKDIDGVGKTVDDLRNKKLFDFGFTDPTKIEVHAGEVSTVLTKSGEDWQRAGKKMESAEVQKLIDRLRDLQAAKFVTSGFTPPPVMRLVVVSNDGKRTEKVEIIKSAAAYIAKRENEPALYEVGSVAAEEIQQLARDLKEAAPPAPAKK